MIHDLEIILHLVRSPVQTIDAVGVPVMGRGEDIANARLRFENGCVANITSSRISPEQMRKIRVFQEDAYLSLDYQNQSGEMHRRTAEGITREEVEIEREEPLKRQLASFIECAQTGGAPKVSGLQAAAALELAVEITKRITRMVKVDRALRRAMVIRPFGWGICLSSRAERPIRLISAVNAHPPSTLSRGRRAVTNMGPP